MSSGGYVSPGDILWRLDERSAKLWEQCRPASGQVAVLGSDVAEQ